MKTLFAILGVSVASNAFAVEYHVGANHPLKTISAAAELAQPGDTITVHAGVYREWVNPPRGGASDNERITYRAAEGETVIVTGSEKVDGWEHVAGDTWKVVIPNKFFGKFNPYSEQVYGDWFAPQGRVHHRGCVYLNDVWMTEAPSVDAVLDPAGATPLWFAKVDGDAGNAPAHLMNLTWFKTVAGKAIPSVETSERSGTQNAACSEGGQCVGWIGRDNWLRYDNVDFGAGTESVEVRAAAAAGTGGIIEFRLENAAGELLGVCEVPTTGDWQQWRTFTAKIKKTAGKRNLCMVFKSPGELNSDAADGVENTTIWARFPGVNPNEAAVEINVRPTVFTPSVTNIDYITVRGFELRNAATNWAAPTAGQVGLVTAYWCKGWIIEHNEIYHSRCGGVALGKYSDRWDGQRGTTEGYYLTIDDALMKDGWSKEKIGGHLVRDNHIHHCGQVGIVGSLGCAFSRVEGNEIHDCNLQGIWGGAEMAGIKFHGAIDTVITGNHIYRCGNLGGIWLDWMAQGTQVTNNLLHDNQGQDLFTEVDHGPYLIANNIMLSPVAHLSNSQGGAYVHNLMVGKIHAPFDGRRTPYHKPHGTELVGMHNCPVGDVRWHNNLLAGNCNLSAYDQATLPVTAVGNVFTKAATGSKFERDALLKADFDTDIKLTQEPDGWYLTITLDKAWGASPRRQLVTTELLGKATIPDQPFENPDGSPLRIDHDYFGRKREASSPFPGPIEVTAGGTQTYKVWPVNPVGD
jgi:hypothetical protein